MTDGPHKMLTMGVSLPLYEQLEALAKKRNGPIANAAHSVLSAGIKAITGEDNADRIEALEARITTLRGALEDAIKIIDEHVPEDALGYDSVGDEAVPCGVQTWPIKDEYLSSFRQALKEDK